MKAPHLLQDFTRRSDVLLVGSNLLGLVFGLASTALQARVLGPAGRGEVAVALVPATIIGMLLCFGLPDYFARRAAQGRSLDTVAGESGAFAVLIGILAAAPYAEFIRVHTQAGAPSRGILTAYAALTPLIVYGYSITAAVGGADRWRAVAASRFVPQLVTIAGLAVLMKTGGSALVVGLLLVATTTFGGLFPGLLLRVRPRSIPRYDALRPAVSFGLRGWPAGALALLNQRADVLILTSIAGVTDLGLYAVATTLAAVLNAIAVSVAMPVRNRIVRGERAIVPAASAVLGGAVLVIALAVAAALPVLIPIVLGRPFLPAQDTMVVLLLAQVPLSGIVVLTQSMIAVGRPGAPLFGEAAALVTTVVLVLLFFPRWGIVGAAAATLVSRGISLVVLLALTRRLVVDSPVWRFFVPTRKSLHIMMRDG